MNAFFYRLSVIHARLDTEIRRELKKLKLAVKDRLHHHFMQRPSVPA